MNQILLCLCIFVLNNFVDGTMRTPKDSAEFQIALDKARAGDIIELLPIEYTGEFTVTKSSAIPEIPITVRGVSKSNEITKLSSENGVVLNVTASHYIFRTMWIVNSQTGIVMAGSENEIDGVSIKDTKAGVIVTGEKNKLTAVTFSNVDIGLEVKSNHLTLLHSSITSGNLSLEISKDSCCNLFDNNVFNGYVNVFGNDNTLSANVANGGMLVTGCNNGFKSNVVLQMKLTKKCENPDQGLNVFAKDADENFE